jgi:hypothetical protein
MLIWFVLSLWIVTLVHYAITMNVREIIYIYKNGCLCVCPGITLERL